MRYLMKTFRDKDLYCGVYRLGKNLWYEVPKRSVVKNFREEEFELLISKWITCIITQKHRLGFVEGILKCFQLHLSYTKDLHTKLLPLCSCNAWNHKGHPRRYFFGIHYVLVILSW